MSTRKAGRVKLREILSGQVSVVGGSLSSAKNSMINGGDEGILDYQIGKIVKKVENCLALTGDLNSENHVLSCKNSMDYF